MKRFRQFMKRGKNTVPPSNGSSSPENSPLFLLKKITSRTLKKLPEDTPTFSLSVANGPTKGGTSINVSGINFVSDETSITIGGVTIPALLVKVNSSTSLTFITPPGSAGNVPVSITSPSGTNNVPGGFSYQALSIKKTSSILAKETSRMERARRRGVQKNIRILLNSKVKAREHEDSTPSTAPEGELQNDIPSHPFLGHLQRFDGIDSNVNPEPPLSTVAHREYENQRREQEMEKQLRLGLMPTPGAPAPPKPGYSK